MSKSVPDKLGGYKNKAGYSLDGHAQTGGDSASKTSYGKEDEDESEKLPPWKKARQQINNFDGLNQHNIQVMAETHRKKIAETINRIESADQDVPDRLEKALEALENVEQD